MRKANLADIPKIITILQVTYGEQILYGMEALLSGRIRSEFDYCILISEDNSMVIFFERMGNFKCQIHTYTLKGSRGRKVKSFFFECMDYIISNYGYTLFMTFVPEDNPAADMAARFMGFKSLGMIESAGGLKDEELYMLTKKDYLVKRGK